MLNDISLLAFTLSIVLWDWDISFFSFFLLKKLFIFIEFFFSSMVVVLSNKSLGNILE